MGIDVDGARVFTLNGGHEQRDPTTPFPTARHGRLEVVSDFSGLDTLADTRIALTPCGP